MLLYFLVLALGFIQCESRERKASLVILPPLVLGYDELSFERDDVPAASSKPAPKQPETNAEARRTKEEPDKVPEIEQDKPPEKISEKPLQEIPEQPPSVKPPVKRSKREPPTKPPVKKGKPLKKVARKNKKKINKKGRIGFVKPKPQSIQLTTKAVFRTKEEQEKPPEIKLNKPSKKKTEKPLENKPKKPPESKLVKPAEKSPSLKPTIKRQMREPPKKHPVKKGKPLKKITRKNRKKIHKKGIIV